MSQLKDKNNIVFRLILYNRHDSHTYNKKTWHILQSQYNTNKHVQLFFLKNHNRIIDMVSQFIFLIESINKRIQDDYTY